MYNRYIPQEDGSFLKSRMAEPEEQKTAPDYYREPAPGYQQTNTYAPRKDLNISSFFRNLLPKDLDIEDLIVILLLLLISGHQEDEGNQAMLTLGAYLFL